MKPEHFTFTSFPKLRAPELCKRVTYHRDELRLALASAPPMPTPPVARRMSDTDESYAEHRWKTWKKALPLISPATFRDDYRCDDNVESVGLLCLDFDVPTEDPRAACYAVHEALGGIEVFAYSTSSSTPGAFKLRTMTPNAEPTSVEQEHRDSFATARRVLAAAGIEVDQVCSNPSRAFFSWVVPPSGAYFWIHIEGEHWPALEAAAVEARRREAEAKARAERARQRRPVARTGDVVERARRYLAAMPPAISGAGGHAATFEAALVLVRGFELELDVALEILTNDYNPRCDPPWSASELKRKIDQADRRGRRAAGWLRGA